MRFARPLFFSLALLFSVADSWGQEDRERELIEHFDTDSDGRLDGQERARVRERIAELKSLRQERADGAGRGQKRFEERAKARGRDMRGARAERKGPAVGRGLVAPKRPLRFGKPAKPEKLGRKALERREKHPRPEDVERRRPLHCGGGAPTEETGSARRARARGGDGSTTGARRSRTSVQAQRPGRRGAR